LPLEFFFYFLIFLAKTYIEKEVKKSNLEIIDLIQKSVDRELSSIKRISNALIYNPIFTPFVFLDKPYTAMKAQDTLETIVAAIPLIETLGASYYNDDYLLTDKTSALKSRYFASIGLDWKKMNDRDLLNQGHIVNDKYLIFLEPMSQFNNNTPGYFFFVFNRAHLSHSIFPRSINDDMNQFISISDTEGTILVDNFPNPDFSFSKFVQTDYFSLTTNFKYSFYLNESIYLDLATKVFLMLYVSMLISISLGSIIIFFISRFNYSPVRHLSEILNKSDKKPSLRERSEFEYIEETLVSFMKYSDDPNSFHDVEIRSRREDIADNCINGLYKNNEAFIHDLNLAEVDNRFKSFAFVRILLTKRDNFFNLSSDYFHLKGSLSCMNPRIDKNQFLYLMNCCDEESSRLILNDFCEQINLQSNSILTYGVGLLKSNADSLAQSYFEATTAMEYRLIRGLGKIIHYKTIPEPDNIDLEKVKIVLQNISNAMLIADKNTLISSFKRLTSLSSDLSLSGARFIYWSLIKVIQDAMNGYDLSSEEKLILVELKINRLAEFETLHQISSFIEKWVDEIGTIISNKEPNKNEIICKRIKEYIIQNINNLQLSLTDISQHVNLSKGYVCRLFKEIEGETILTYIKKVRFEKSCQLLKETTLPIGDIVLNVGYIDSANFIREFKKKFDITPGQYRESYNNGT
jgi:two-component system response regulator YesN